MSCLNQLFSRDTLENLLNLLGTGTVNGLFGNQIINQPKWSLSPCSVHKQQVIDVGR